MNQKSWETNNTKTKTKNICPCCSEPITNHQHYTDYRFCESCHNMIVKDYQRKCNDLDDKEQIEYFSWHSAEDFLQSVYEELR